jgi:hypothetical protein
MPPLASADASDFRSPVPLPELQAGITVVAHSVPKMNCGTNELFFRRAMSG